MADKDPLDDDEIGRNTSDDKTKNPVPGAASRHSGDTRDPAPLGHSGDTRKPT